jgi:pimeloyl-ACP methyl ester carboxylesterase
LFVADELGTVVFLHGFPEIWYTWRHQMLAAAAAGYRAIAPDCRGYGLSDQPPENEESSWVWDDLVADVLAILDAFSVPKVGEPAELLKVHPRNRSEILSWP